MSLTISWRRRWNALSSGLQVTARRGGTVNTVENGGAQTCWRNGGNKSLIKFGKDKRRVLYMGSRAFCSVTGWDGLVPGSSAGKFLEFAVVSKLNMSHQCVSATEMANCLLSCRNKRRAHSRNQNNCLFPFTCHSLECYKATLSSLSQLHPVKTSRKSIIE